LLTNTVVQMLVDANGLPVSVTLLASSGLKEADDYALAQARQTRFEAAAAETQPQAIALRDLSWGQLVFNWHTLPQAPDASGQPKR
jgi:TonB family protein